MSSLRTKFLPALICAASLTAVIALGHWLEMHPPKTVSAVEDESSYFTPATIKRISLGFNGLVADWYWMQSLQYVGKKVISFEDTHPGDVQIDSVGSLDLRALPGLLDTATTLDPQFIAVYEYGAVLLPSIDQEDAVNLLKKGIAANPGVWQLYHDLGYIYWQSGQFQTASETYAKGATVAGAPIWMKAMSARMAAEGGSRDTAREIFQRMLEDSSDDQIREMAARHLLQITSFDQRDIITAALAEFHKLNQRCPGSWKEIAGALRAAHLQLDNEGAPLDPAGTPYVLTNQGCNVDLDPRSRVPYK